MSGIFELKTVQELLGHKTLTMTLRYSHLAASHKGKALDTLEKTLTGQPRVQKKSIIRKKKEATANA
jgi:site-specific recombinase XerC